MTLSPSELTFVSYLKYHPSGTSKVTKDSKQIVLQIKNDRNQIIKRISEKIAARRSTFECLKRVFDDDVTLVPIPGHARRVEGGLWIAKRICEELVGFGLAESFCPCIERKITIQKSAYAKPGESRPSPEDHFNSTIVTDDIISTRRVTLVDDVITRGSSLVGLTHLLKQRYPRLIIERFAIVRTVREEFEAVLDPIEGIIRDKGNNFVRREP